MSKEDNDFTEKDYNRILDDIIDDFFDQRNINFDMKELVKTGMLGDSVPEGYHRMPDTGELMLDSDMPGFEGG